MSSRILLSLGAAALLPTIASAHDGHGHYPATQLLHYLTAPEHIVQTSLVVGALVAYLLFRSVKWAKKAR
jgi:hypothetical protein